MLEAPLPGSPWSPLRVNTIVWLSNTVPPPPLLYNSTFNVVKVDSVGIV